jgi:murein DD-endopeptidase MepM/ murein hydrolase activator NlpD
MTICVGLGAVATAAAQDDTGTGGATPGGASPRTAPTLQATPGEVLHGEHIEAQVVARKVAFGATQTPQLRYTLKGDVPMDVIVDVVRATDGRVISQFPRVTAAPGVPQTVTWNGLAGKRVSKAGRYAFRVYVLPEGATASTAQAGAEIEGAFIFLPHVFPILGAHDYGEYAASFGGGRGHQGQDVFAACGTPLVAARGGRVKHKAFQSRAGNYLVIDADKSGYDMAYMHLRDPALVSKGDRVVTGQVIGYVGETGRAHGCHLHFELWTAPGWYTGGRAINPLPALRAWDVATSGSTASARATSRRRGSSSRGK